MPQHLLEGQVHKTLATFDHPSLWIANGTPLANFLLSERFIKVIEKRVTIEFNTVVANANGNVYQT